MKVLITGVAGFLGSHLADHFISKNATVVGIDNLVGGYKDNVPKNVEFHNLDLADLNCISPLFCDVDIVIHSACTAYEGLSVFSPNLIVQNTTQITASVLSASVKAKIKKFIYLSSMARYGKQEQVPFVESMIPNPQDPYGIAKYASELLTKNILETHGIEYTILVPHNIIGPRQKYDDPFRNVASIMINRMIQGKQPVIYGDGNQKRCFSFIEDVVTPIYRSCELGKFHGEIVNIGPDKEFISINKLAEIIASKLNFPLKAIYFPGRPQEVFHANCSADKAREIFDYKTQTNLSEGIDSLIKYIKDCGSKEFVYHLPIEISNDLTPITWTQQLI
jgi:UDP-glucose 4-epimerase